MVAIEFENHDGSTETLEISGYGEALDFVLTLGVGAKAGIIERPDVYADILA